MPLRCSRAADLGAIATPTMLNLEAIQGASWPMLGVNPAAKWEAGVASNMLGPSSRANARHGLGKHEMQEGLADINLRINFYRNWVTNRI